MTCDMLRAEYMCRFLLGVALALAVAPCAFAKDKQAPISVYVFTTPSADGFTEMDSKARHDSVADLKDALEFQDSSIFGRRRRISLAADAEHADSKGVTARSTAPSAIVPHRAMPSGRK